MHCCNVASGGSDKQSSTEAISELGQHVGQTHQEVWGAKKLLASYASCWYFSEALKGLPAAVLF